MTTYFAFQPSPSVAPSFQPTLDGSQYTITVLWSLAGQRYYVQCQTLTGQLVFFLPLIGSSTGMAVQSVSWVPNTITVSVAQPHNFSIGSIVNLTFDGMMPSTFNGIFPCLITSPTQFTYTQASNPGQIVSLGFVSYNIDIAAGYFNSTMVYREDNQNFEVSP